MIPGGRLSTWLTLSLAACAAPAAEPTIRGIDLRGLRLGETTRISVDGADLLPNPRLLLPFAIAKQELAAAATGTKAVFSVSIADEVAPGIYNLRLTTDDGATAPIAIGIDRLPQLPFAAEVESLPVALHGSVSGSTVARTRFRAKAGEEVTIDVEAQRLGSKLRPVVHLYDDRRVQLAWAWPVPSLFGDARLAARLPADGVYTIELHDAEYAAPAQNYFRLKIGNWDYAEQAFPPAIERGKPTAVQHIGNRSTPLVDVEPPAAAGWIPLPFVDTGRGSGIWPRVRLSETSELIESNDPSNPQPLPAIPVAVSGRLSQTGEEDRYRLEATSGSKLRFEVFAERYGSPLDVVLTIKNEQGQQLARGEDGPGTLDPLLEFTVPDKASSLVVAIADVQQRGGERSIYRLAIEEVGSATRQPDFDLSVSADRIRAACCRGRLVAVLANRRGYQGPIRLALDPLPAGASLDTAEIPAGADGALVAVTSDASTLETQIVRLRGTSDDGRIARLAETTDHPLGTLQPWLRNELAVSQVSASPLNIELAELPTDAQLVLGGKLPIPLKLDRGEGLAGPVRLSLVTSQNVPLANGRPDSNKSLRLEAAVEIAADKSEGQIVVLTPPDLPGKLYDLAVQAELLSVDKQKVLATAHSAVRRLPVFNPIALMLVDGPRFETPLDAKIGATFKIAGKIERRGGFQGDVTVTATSLPAGIRVAPVVVKSDAVEFELPLVFPANFKPGEVKGIKLSASAIPDPKLPQALVRSEVEILLLLNPPQ